MVFSILIPVYNVEKYLRQCLESVLEQDFPDYEIILVNDGSTDSSPSICKEFARKDARIKYFEKENEGLLQTRRYSIKKASGDYLLFLDSDDYWEPGILTALYTEISRQIIDLIVYRFRTVTDSGKRISEKKGLFPDRTVFTENNKELFIKEFASTRMNNLWIKCVRKAIVDADTDYSKFGDRKGEDLLQSIPLVRNAATILYMDDIFVNYRLSVTGRGRNFRIRYLEDYEEVSQILRDYLDEINSSDEIMACFYISYLDMLMSFMDSIVSVSADYRTFLKICSHFQNSPLYQGARHTVTPSTIKSIKHRIDYILLEDNRYLLLYNGHKVKNYLKKILNIE